jgi:CBS domain-containing protein
MNLKIADLMAKRVIVAQPHHTVEHVRGLMKRNRIHAVPVVGDEGEPVGIVSATDLADNLKDNMPINRLMTKDVRKIPAYNDVSAAASVMRRHKIHHVVVTTGNRDYQLFRFVKADRRATVCR